MIVFDDINDNSIKYILSPFDIENIDEVSYYDRSNLNVFYKANIENYTITFDNLIYGRNYIVECLKNNNLVSRFSFKFRGKTREELFISLNPNNDEEIDKIFSKIPSDIKYIKDITKYLYNLNNKECLINFINYYNNLSNYYNHGIENFTLKLDKPNFTIIYDNYLDDNDITLDIIDLNKEHQEPIFLKFNNKEISRKLLSGLYKVIIYNKEEILQNLLYIYFNDDYSNESFKTTLRFLKEKEEKRTESNKILGFNDDFKTEEERQILNILESFYNKRALFPAPTIKIEKNNLYLRFDNEYIDNALFITKYIDEISKFKSVYLFMSEEDQLYNDNANYRKIGLNNLSKNNGGEILLIDNIDELNLNNERYYFWIACDNSIKLSGLYTLDISNSDSKDYNWLFYKRIYKIVLNNLSRFINVNYNSYSFVYNLMYRIINSEESHASLDIKHYLIQETLNSNLDEIDKTHIIYSIMSCFVEHYDNYDFSFHGNIIYKPNYKEIKTELKENEICINTILNKRKISGRNFYNINNLNEYRIDKDKYNIFQFLDLNTFKLSDYIMFYFKDNQLMPIIYNNTIEVNTVYGL